MLRFQKTSQIFKIIQKSENPLEKCLILLDISAFLLVTKLNAHPVNPVAVIHLKKENEYRSLN
jgi:hypothetical protein